jgi:hypothetical protein
METPYELRSLPRSAVSVLPLAHIVMSAVLGLAACAWLVVPSAGSAQAAGGYLPWPAVQWALTTPAATVALTLALGLLMAPVIALPIMLIQFRVTPGQWLVGSADVTNVSILRWSRYPMAGAPRTRMDCWLGQTRRSQLVSLGLAVASLALWLVVALGGIVLWLQYMADHPSVCAGNRCAPFYPLPVAVCVWAGAALGGLLAAVPRSRWLRRVEAECGIRFRLRAWWGGLPLYYVRQPGVTAEAAAEALLRLTPQRAIPWLRIWAIQAVAALPFVLLFLASLVLGAWLRTQWIPR